MIKKAFVLLLMFFYSYVGRTAENIELNSIEEYVIREDNVIDFIIGSSGIIDVKKINNEFIVTPIALTGKTYILFLKSKENISYIIEVKNNRSEGLNKKRTKLVSGTLKGTIGFSEKSKQNPYFLNLSLTTRLTDDSTFTFTGDHFNNSETSLTSLTSWTYSLQDYYLAWSLFPEPTTAPYYISNNFRGYTVGKQNKNIDIGGWTGNKFLSNKEEYKSFMANGFFLIDHYDDFSYKFLLNKKDNRYIPQTSFSFNYLNMINTISGSFFEEKYSFRYSGVKNFNKNSEDFNLKSITGVYSTAPKGAYGLDNKNNNFYENYGFNINFSNQEKKISEVQRDIDFMQGVVFSVFSYDAGIFNETRNDSLSLSAGYGNFEKLTFSSGINYTLSSIGRTKSEQFFYSPRLSFFLSGDKDKGFSVRNEYSSTITKDYTEKFSENYRNIIGLYKNNRKYYVGSYVGNSDFSSKNIEISSRVFGIDSVYWVKDNLNFRIFGENVTALNTGNYENGISFESRGIYKDFSLYAKIKYEEKNDMINNQKQSSTVGSIGFVWDFGYGEGNIYTNVGSITKSISGILYNDLNFNGKKDVDEPVLPGIRVSVIKTGINQQISDINGSFNFYGFSPKESVSISTNSDLYVTGQLVTLSMDKSHNIEIPMYEFDLKKVYIKDSKNEIVISPSIIFSCEKNNKLYNELYSEYTLYYFPKNKKCEPELSTETTGGTIISDIKNIGSDSISITLEVIPKVISFEFTKKSKSFYLNNKLISPNSKIITISINEYNGFLDIKLQKNCNISPENYKTPYNNLKMQNFYKIFCF